MLITCCSNWSGKLSQRQHERCARSLSFTHTLGVVSSASYREAEFGTVGFIKGCG